MNLKCNVRHLQVNRYSQVIPGRIQVQLTEQHVIFNAARPIPGHLTWQADFCHGVFYAAIDTTQPDAARLARQCIGLDGWVLQFIEEEAATTALQAWYDENYPRPVNARDYRFEWLWQSYLEHCAPTTAMLEFNDSSWKE